MKLMDWWAAFLLLASITGGEAGILRPELGVYLESIGTLNPSTEELYATLVLPIPQLPEEAYEIRELPCNAMIPDKQMSLNYDKPPWYYRAEFKSDITADRSEVKVGNENLKIRRT